MLLLAGSLAAQQAVPPQEKEKDEDLPVFKAGVTLVKVDIEVTGRDGRNITDLTQKDFRIFDENELREAAHFGREFEPLDLLLLLDVSGSMRRSLEEVAASTRAALGYLHSGDRVGLMLFSRNAELVQPFTEDFRNTQHKILDSIYKQDLGNGTLINESLIAAAAVLKQQPAKGRRAILIVTDNEGVNYQVSNAEVVRAMDNTDTVLSAIVTLKGPKRPAVRRSGYSNPASAPPDVYQFAAQTGGAAVESVSKTGELFEKVIERIRSRYFIQYPAPPADAGSFRHIRVELTPEARQAHPGAAIRAREGYYATAAP